MKIPGKKIVYRSARWLRSRFVNHGLILGYHRIAEMSQDPYSLCVSPENFYEQMQVLRKYAYPLSLNEIISVFRSGDLPSRAVAVTFDDGYADVLYQAKPILEELQIPSTVFAVSEYLGEEFWWDELGRMILQASNPAGELVLRMNTQEFKLVLSDEVDYTQRHEVLLSVYRMLRTLPGTIREKKLAQIRVWVNSNPDRLRYTRGLTEEELGTLVQGGLIDLGAHGVSHTDLTMLSPDQYSSEIQMSKEHLAGIIGKPVFGFSYPNGSFSQGIKDKVKEADYHYACASYNDVVCRNSDLYSLPRCWIPDVNGREFYRWLKAWV